MLDFYNTKIFYPLMNRRLGKAQILRLRQETLLPAYGEILEIGLGSGLNLACYPAKVHSITAIDVVPSDRLPLDAGIQIQFQLMSAEKLNFPDASFDCVVSTFTLCSIPAVHAALAEIYRVLKPQGKFIFLEHGRSANKWMGAMQDLLNPFYNLLACGCNINRDVLEMITSSGFSMVSPRVTLCGLPFSGLYFSGVAIKKEPNVEN
ncbi:MAG TPA: class I SAM-dependent methyltransferase [Anaerolineaceae bacterium]|nr:class I SAM-dependent methyltransferase [Anaerolineaceae bacterium]